VLLIAPETAAVSGATVPIQISVGSIYSPNGTSVPTGSVSVSVDGTVVDASRVFSATNVSGSSVSVTTTRVVVG
jgi:hypothetical protein